jgi:outer membrane protein TolC
MFRNPIVQSIIVALCVTHVTSAQTPSSPDSSLRAILSGLKGTSLSLQQAVQHALKNATSVRKAEAVYLAAEGSERKEAGQFDPTLFFNLNYQDQKQPVASYFAGGVNLATKQTTSRTGVRMNLPIGTQLELGISTIKLNTSNSFALLNPEYDASGSLSLRQPLLGGFAASARKQLTKSERDLDAAKARYDQQVLAVSTDVERVYWDLYAAERDYAVQVLIHDRAETFLRETELRAKTGLIGPNQVANAKTFLAQQTIQLLEREEQLDRQSDQLASLIGVRPEPGMSRFIPSDEPSSDYAVDSVEVLVEHALKNNLDLQAAKQDVEAQRALANAAGWEALPSVNLVGSLGGNGLAGVPQTVMLNGVPFPKIPGGTFGDVLQQVTKRQFETWSVGVEVNVPIGLRSGFGEKDRVEANVLGAEQRYIEQSRALADQVRATCRDLWHGKARLEAARDGVDAAQEQVRIGLIEFHNGRLTAFELTRLGEDFAVAQQRYSSALVHTAKAAATLRQLTSGRYQTNH